MQRVEHSSKGKYALSVVGRLNEMRKRDKHCDFIIRVRDKDILAHRSVLGAGSQYFHALLTTDTEENKSGVVEMPDADFECAELCVANIYGEDAYVPVEKCTELMFVANAMKLRGLCNAVVKLLQKTLNLESFYSVKNIGETYGYSDLSEKCKIFAIENLVSISKSDEFGTVDKGILMEAVKKLQVCEEEKVDILLKWIKSCPTKDESLMEVIECVNLRKIPAHHLRYLIENETTISGNAECLLHFTMSAMDVMKVSSRREPKSLIGLFDKESGHLLSYNPRENTLKEMHRLNKDMMEKHFRAITLGDYIYVLLQTRMVYRLEYANEKAKWQRMSSMTQDHGWFPPATVSSNFIYVVSGSHENSTTCVERYNPERNRWTKLKGKVIPLSDCTPVAHDRQIYTFGGNMDGRYTGTTMKFIPSKSKWVQMRSMMTGRGNPGAVVLNGKVYVIGGYGITTDLEFGKHKQELECYDIATGVWTSLKPMIAGRFGCRALSIDGAIYAIGGDFGGLDSLEKYNVETNEWSTIKMAEDTKLKIQDAVEIRLVDC